MSQMIDRTTFSWKLNAKLCLNSILNLHSNWYHHLKGWYVRKRDRMKSLTILYFRQTWQWCHHNDEILLIETVWSQFCDPPLDTWLSKQDSFPCWKLWCHKSLRNENFKSIYFHILQYFDQDELFLVQHR